MDCPICYNLIRNSCIGSCTHHFCFPCLINWTLYGGQTCPLCKTFIGEIRFDKEMDVLLSKINNDVSFEVINQEIQCNKCYHINIGSVIDNMMITLENNKGPGVIISKINRKGVAYKKGLRRGDNILFLNNIPCVNYGQAVQIINNCQKLGRSMDFLILKNRSIYK